MKSKMVEGVFQMFVLYGHSSPPHPSNNNPSVCTASPKWSNLFILFFLFFLIIVSTLIDFNVRNDLVWTTDL